MSYDEKINLKLIGRNLEDLKVIRQRIQKKIEMKPEWYRKTEYIR